MPSNALSLDMFERLVYSRRYDPAASMLLQIIESIELKTFDLIPDDSPTRDSGEVKLALMTRFVAAITTMIADPGFNLKEPLFIKLMLYKRYLVSLFGITSVSNMDHLVSLSGEGDGSGQVEFKSESAVFKLMLTSSIFSQQELVLKTLEAAPRRFKLIYWISLLDTESVLDSDADKLRNRLLSEGEALQNDLAPDHFIVRLINIWMFISYFTTPEKHEAKKYINSMLLRWMKKQGVSQPAPHPAKNSDEKPKLLILSERFTSNHAMYRCYSPSIAQLKSKFHTTLVSTTEAHDEVSKSIFDEVIAFDRNEGIKKIIGRIIKARPDIIYYPSVGMDSWTIMACQLRLAPVQMMTMGHPATTKCDSMDYALIEEFSFGDAQCFSETVVLKDEGAKFAPYDDNDPPVPVIREAPDVLKVAIPATMYKLNSDFLTVCKNVQNRSKRKVEFHFFPNRMGVMLDFASQMITKVLPTAKVYSSATYSEYMGLLNACDIHFSTFPFGLANGMVDSSLCALPMVALDGPEVHSHSDVGFQQRLGLPGWLSTQSHIEFEEAALRLVEDDSLRVQLSKDLVSADPAKLFFAENSTDADYFANLVDWIYRNHEAMQSDGRKVWTEAEFKDAQFGAALVG